VPKEGRVKTFRPLWNLRWASPADLPSCSVPR
jgi:hypothetical protein